MKRVIVSITLVLLAILCLSEYPALAGDDINKSDNFQCGSYIVSVGDTKAEVIISCGKPTYQETEGSKETIKRGIAGSSLDYETKSTNIEKWYYNRGANDFIYVLTFEGGTLKSIEARGYGK